MIVKVGIPRGLLYYDYIPLWKTFFERLGAEVIVSDATCKQTLDHGLRVTVDDACLPIKVYFGHVMNLCGRVDYIFAPRIVSVERRSYICPKFMGLPDMLRNILTDDEAPKIIDTCIDLSKGRGLVDGVLETGRHFTRDPIKIWWSYLKARSELIRYRKAVLAGQLPEQALTKKVMNHEPAELSVAVLGHSYNVYDSYTTMNLIKKLRQNNVAVLTAEMVPEPYIERELASLDKKELFWTLGKRILGAANYFHKAQRVDGIIHVASFGCGPDSLVGEIVTRQVRRAQDIPIMELNIDEHSGEAGILTRIEAFVDMVKWRKGL